VHCAYVVVVEMEQVQTLVSYTTGAFSPIVRFIMIIVSYRSGTS
jgi:hypothetical protein